MNEMIERMISRHAIRRFLPRQVEEAALEEILLAGLYAPSAGNNQGTRIAVSQDRETNLRLGQLSREMQFPAADSSQPVQPVSSDQPSIKDDLTLLDGFYGAPTVLTLFTPRMKYTREDAAMVAENIQLAAHFLGIGACYVGRTEEVFATDYGRALRKQWQIPDDLIAVGNVLLGYRDGPAPRAKPRKENRILRLAARQKS